jgi:rifampin ADP-ribosylating transferase
MTSESVSVSGPVDIEPTAKQPVADLIEPGYTSNYGKKKKATYIYLTGTLDAATWGQSWHSAKVPAEST